LGVRLLKNLRSLKRDLSRKIHNIYIIRVLPRRGLRNFKMPSQGDDWDFIDYIRIFLISLNVIGVLSFVLFGILYSFGMLFVFINWLWIKLRKNKEISSEEILRPLNRTLADA